MLRKFIRFMNPPIDEEILKEIDGNSFRSIRIISLSVFLFEVVTIIMFFISNINGLDHEKMLSLISVCYCIILCATAYYLSNKMLQSRKLSHKWFFTFKILFFILFTAWAVFIDYRHYKHGDQMITFFAVNLTMSCFVIFRPWIGTVLVSGSFAGLYAALYSVDKAAGIQPENFIVLALISMACNAVRCHAQIKAATQTIRLNETISELKSASRRDGLTGLLNRLALEDDASTADGRQMTAYMIFLVLTYKAPEENYGSDTYDFRQEKYGVTVDLSIGNAQGSPSNYQEVFDLISKADKALYITKQRTHSAEYGGHDRRK